MTEEEKANIHVYLELFRANTIRNGNVVPLLNDNVRTAIAKVILEKMGDVNITYKDHNSEHTAESVEREAKEQLQKEE